MYKSMNKRGYKYPTPKVLVRIILILFIFAVLIGLFIALKNKLFV